MIHLQSSPRIKIYPKSEIDKYIKVIQNSYKTADMSFFQTTEVEDNNGFMFPTKELNGKIWIRAEEDGGLPLSVKKAVNGDLILCFEVLPSEFDFPNSQEEFEFNSANIVVLDKMIKNVERICKGLTQDEIGYLAHEAVHLIDLQSSNQDYNEGADNLTDNFAKHNILEINAFLNEIIYETPNAQNSKDDFIKALMKNRMYAGLGIIENTQKLIKMPEFDKYLSMVIKNK